MTTSQSEHLRTTLLSQRGFIRHWMEDVACGLKPTTASLNAALKDVDAAIAELSKPLDVA